MYSILLLLCGFFAQIAVCNYWAYINTGFGTTCSMVLDFTLNQVNWTFTGPSGNWFGFGFGQNYMYGYGLIFNNGSSNGGYFETNIENHVQPISQTNQNTTCSYIINSGTITYTCTRALTTTDSNDYQGSSWTLGSNNIIYSIGNKPFNQHFNRNPGTWTIKTITPAPTPYPTIEPTHQPTPSPSPNPSNPPTSAPVPTFDPTHVPSFNPTRTPTRAPIIGTFSPSKLPTFNPSNQPTPVPTPSPTLVPTNNPTTPMPTAKPTSAPISPDWIGYFSKSTTQTSVNISIYESIGQMELTFKGPSSKYFGFGFGQTSMSGYALVLNMNDDHSYFETNLVHGNTPVAQSIQNTDCSNMEINNGFITYYCKRSYTSNDTNDFSSWSLGGSNKIIYSQGASTTLVEHAIKGIDTFTITDSSGGGGSSSSSEGSNLFVNFGIFVSCFIVIVNILY